MNFRPSPLTAALLLAITAPAMAAPTGDAPADAAMQAKELDTVEVHGERVQKASSPKYTEKPRLPKCFSARSIASVTSAGLNEPKPSYENPNPT